MKARYILIIVILLSRYMFCHADNYLYDHYEINDNDTLYYNFHDWRFYNKSRNIIEFDTLAGKINDIKVSNGKITKLGDNKYAIYPENLGEIIIYVTTKKFFQIKRKVISLPNPEIHIKNHSRGALSLEELENIEIIANWGIYNYEIKEFWVSATIKGFVRNIQSRSNKFTEEQIDLINLAYKYRGDGVKFYIEDVRTLGPDSIIRINSDIYNNADYLTCRIFNNKIDAFVNDYYFGLPLLSNLRIKIEGSPTQKDIQTVNEIVTEFNQLLENINVKIVKKFPSYIINFDSINTYKEQYKFWMSPTMTETEPLLFYPSQNKTILNIGIKDTPQEIRSCLIWHYLTNYLVKVKVTYPQSSIFNYDKDKTGLSDFEKNILQMAFSKEGYQKITKKYYSEHKKEFPTKMLLFLLLSFILILIAIEANNSYKILNAIKNEFLKNIISYLIISQLVVISLFIIYGSEILKIEKYLVPFSIVTGVLLYLADKLISKIKATWGMLLSEIIFTSIALFVSYNIVYLFTRGEILKFNIFNENIFLILISIVLVRVLIRYSIIKVGYVIREKDIKISQQSELLVKSQLNAIQARINPHFLYNSLNSIAELVGIDSNRTEKMALALSKLFQYNLNRENKMKAKISEEIEVVEQYLFVEKQRFDDKLEYEIEVDKTLKNKEIPKFLLQPLVENAIKHGISKNLKKGIIKVEINSVDDDLSIKIFDNGPDFPDGIINGYGLQNTYEKLDMVYQKPYEIRFINGEDKHIWLLLKN